MKNIIEELKSMGLENKSRRVQKLSSNIEYRRLHLWALQEIISELNKISEKIDQEQNNDTKKDSAKA
ncbi:MAG: hypothetical protein VR69_00450 [Peptococcaceae bacterium BRH_c4b]|nr:MAG: hypothetical protein VR69_00450 [Peptococcaceae bacterium BRH_c4b]